MTNRLLHTPEGVRDIYSAECRRKLALEDKMLEVLYLYGYEHIETPSFEYFDIFNKDRGSVGDREMFKFFDRDNNTLVLKPDMTPAVARCVAKYYMDENSPLRLCYLERTFKNNTSYQGRLKETTQTGAELIGDDSEQADAELLALIIEALKTAGLKEFQVELGHADFYRGLAEEAGMDEDTQEQLRDLIENKNYFGVDELLSSRNLPEETKQGFLRLLEMFGSAGQIAQAKELTTNPRALKAIARLERIQELLEDYGLADYVSYDLGMVSRYQYYTGIIFKGYTYGTGDYIVTGGRYDRLLEQFGKNSPAVGFAIEVDRVLTALLRQRIDIPFTQVSALILFDGSAEKQAIRLGRHFRSLSLPVVTSLKRPDISIEAYRKMAFSRKIRTILYLEEDKETVEAMDLINGSINQIPISDYMIPEVKKL